MPAEWLFSGPWIRAGALMPRRVGWRSRPPRPGWGGCASSRGSGRRFRRGRSWRPRACGSGRPRGRPGCELGVGKDRCGADVGVHVMRVEAERVLRDRHAHPPRHGCERPVRQADDVARRGDTGLGRLQVLVDRDALAVRIDAGLIQGERAEGRFPPGCDEQGIGRDRPIGALVADRDLRLARDAATGRARPTEPAALDERERPSPTARPTALMPATPAPITIRSCVCIHGSSSMSSADRCRYREHP